jgi:hypothetical protein
MRNESRPGRQSASELDRDVVHGAVGHMVSGIAAEQSEHTCRRGITTSQPGSDVPSELSSQGGPHRPARRTDRARRTPACARHSRPAGPATPSWSPNSTGWPALCTTRETSSNELTSREVKLCGHADRADDGRALTAVLAIYQAGTDDRQAGSCSVSCRLWKSKCWVGYRYRSDRVM